MPPFAKAFTAALLLIALPRVCHAQQVAADALFDSARAAMEKGDLATACKQFRASDQLDAAAGTELNLADCEERRGHLASAWELYRTAAEKLSERDERLALARSRIQALTPRLPRLTLVLAAGAPQTSSVLDGATELGSAAFGVPLPIDPGSHELIVSAPGFESRKFVVSFAEGEARTLTVWPGDATRRPSTSGSAAPRSTPGSVTPPAREQAAPDSGKRWLGFGLAGVGVVGLGVGTVAGLMTLGKKSTVDAECQPDKSCSSAGVSAAESGHRLQTVSNVGWVLGAAALGAGAYFLLSGGSSSRPSTSVALVTNSAGGRLALSRSF